jgi:hypothetical protein
MLKRPIAAILLLTAAAQLAGCAIHTHTSVRPGDLRPEERGAASLTLASVTVADGESVFLDRQPPPRLEGDTLYASRLGAPIRIPRSAIRGMLVAGPGGRTRYVRTARMEIAADSVLGRRILRLTMRDGTRMRFDSWQPLYVAGDTVYGSVNGEPRRAALADVDRLVVRRRNGALSVAATASLVALAGATVYAMVQVVRALRAVATITTLR